jgi:hypothetical protein
MNAGNMPNTLCQAVSDLQMPQQTILQTGHNVNGATIPQQQLDVCAYMQASTLRRKSPMPGRTVTNTDGNIYILEVESQWYQCQTRAHRAG